MCLGGLEATVVCVFTRQRDNREFLSSARPVFSCLVFPSGEIEIVGLRPLEVVPFMELEFWHYRPQIDVLRTVVFQYCSLCIITARVSQLGLLLA